jgi:hypothetical protein
MPVKRRIGKARPFSDHQREQLLEGLDACLLAGVGYLAPYTVATFGQLEPEERAEVLAAMRTDWARHGPEMMERWRAAAPDPAMTPPSPVEPGGRERRPWAAEAFGEP